MKLNRFFAAFAAVSLTIIGTLAWYVVAGSQSGTPSDYPTPEQGTHADSRSDASLGIAFRTPEAADDSGGGQVSAALSEHVVYGPRAIPSSDTEVDSGNLPFEILDTSPVAAPMALLDPPKEMLSNPLQADGLATLRKEFAEAIGLGKLDPESPEYRKAWVAAQPALDERYRQFFGDDAYMAQQIAQFRDKDQQAAAR